MTIKRGEDEGDEDGRVEVIDEDELSLFYEMELGREAEEPEENSGEKEERRGSNDGRRGGKFKGRGGIRGLGRDVIPEKPEKPEKSERSDDSHHVVLAVAQETPQKEAAKNKEGEKMLGRGFKLCQAMLGEEGRIQEKKRLKGRKQLKGKKRGKGGKRQERHDVGTGPTMLDWIQLQRRDDSTDGDKTRDRES